MLQKNFLGVKLLKKILKNEIADHRKIWDYFSPEIQFDKLIEEVDELKDALFNYAKHENEETKREFDLECADVFLLLMQRYSIDPEFRAACKGKKKRTLARLDSGYYLEDRNG